MLEEEDAAEQPEPEADAAEPPAWENPEFRSAIQEVVALTGAQEDTPEGDDEVQSRVNEAPIARLANTILQAAIKERASEINLEPQPNIVAVRFRIDGVLHEVMHMPGYILAPLTRRYKVIAGVDIIEYRLPQQGHIGCRYQGLEYNLRYNTLPTPYGEQTIIHIPTLPVPKLSMDNLGMSSEMQARLEELLFWQRGMVLIASGNGQGKTTSLYVLLNRLNHVGQSIFAVAPYYDHVLQGITQARLNPKIGYTAEAVLASIAELNPEVVGLDRCHTKEAIRLALEMAAANVVVLQTVAVSGALSALRFLMSIAEPSTAAGRVSGVLAQTLVRRICTDCKEFYEVPAGDLRGSGYKVTDPNETVQLARGKGCERCRHTGYKGRIGLFELVTMNAEIAEAITNRVSPTQMEQVIRRTHPLTMRADGLAKILQGITTPEEVVHAVPVLTWAGG